MHRRLSFFFFKKKLVQILIRYLCESPRMDFVAVYKRRGEADVSNQKQKFPTPLLGGVRLSELYIYYEFVQSRLVLVRWHVYCVPRD